jgi:anti-anti-sigma regulatory factor
MLFNKLVYGASFQFVVVDFMQVSCLDFSAAELFLLVRRKILKAGKTLILCNVESSIVDIMESVGIFVPDIGLFLRV